MPKTNQDSPGSVHLRDLNKRIKEARSNAQLHQYQLADIIGVNRTAVSKWERNLTVPIYPTLENLYSIAVACKVPVVELLGGEPARQVDEDLVNAVRHLVGELNPGILHYFNYNVKKLFDIALQGGGQLVEIVRPGDSYDAANALGRLILADKLLGGVENKTLIIYTPRTRIKQLDLPELEGIRVVELTTIGQIADYMANLKYER